MNWPKETIRQARALYLELKNSQSVATALGVPSTTVARWCRDLTAIEDKVWDDKLEMLKKSVATIPNFNIAQWAKENDISVRVARKHVLGIERPFVEKTSTVTEASLTNPNRIKARELYASGKSYGDIHRETGIPKGTISTYCADLVDSSKKTRSYSPDEEASMREKCRALYLTNKTIGEVAAELKIGLDRAKGFCRDLIDHRRESGSRIVHPRQKVRLYHQVLNDDQVIEMRREVRVTQTKNWNGWAKKFGVSMSVISMAARGVTFKHLNHIEAPIPKDPMVPVRPVTKEWITPKIDEAMVAEAIALYKADPDKWDFTSLGEWMSEKTGRKYKANHISILFSNREPDMVMPKKRKYIPPKPKGPRKVYKPTTEQAERRNQIRKAARAQLRRMIEEEGAYERGLQELEKQKKDAV